MHFSTFSEKMFLPIDWVFVRSPVTSRGGRSSREKGRSHLKERSYMSWWKSRQVLQPSHLCATSAELSWCPGGSERRWVRGGGVLDGEWAAAIMELWTTCRTAWDRMGPWGNSRWAPLQTSPHCGNWGSQRWEKLTPEIHHTELRAFLLVRF